LLLLTRHNLPSESHSWSIFALLVLFHGVLCPHMSTECAFSPH
jgi:hypothetical protein